ncbi:MAG: hypothetical protein AB1505_09810 [Candidatus Latescibacterota bacterium]
MPVPTYEGIVENGLIRLNEGVRLPEKAKVYVVVPGAAVPAGEHLRSPRLTNSRDAADFAKTIVEGPDGARV